MMLWDSLEGRIRFKKCSGAIINTKNALRKRQPYLRMELAKT